MQLSRVIPPVTYLFTCAFTFSSIFDYLRECLFVYSFLRWMNLIFSNFGKCGIVLCLIVFVEICNFITSYGIAFFYDLFKFYFQLHSVD